MFWTNFTQPQQIGEFWLKAMKDQLTRAETMQKELERIEAHTVERTSEAFEESTKLARESIAYSQKLQADWRKISIDAFKKSSEMFGVAV